MHNAEGSRENDTLGKSQKINAGKYINTHTPDQKRRVAKKYRITRELSLLSNAEGGQQKGHVPT